MPWSQPDAIDWANQNRRAQAGAVIEGFGLTAGSVWPESSVLGVSSTLRATGLPATDAVQLL